MWSANRACSMPLPEENILAMLDVIGVREKGDIKDDMISFLNAVRGLCVTPQTPQAPTRKMHAAVFRIFRDSEYLDLTILSFQLLTDLAKSFPLVTVPKDKSRKRLLINRDVWSPFIPNLPNSSNGMNGVPNGSCEALDSPKLFSLIKELESDICADLPRSSAAKPNPFKMPLTPGGHIVTRALMVGYLLNLLENDFCCRYEVFKSNEEWSLLRDSHLNQILGSQRTSFIHLVKSSLRIIATEIRFYDIDMYNGLNDLSTPNKFGEVDDHTMFLANEEIKHMLYFSLQRFLILMMKLDTVKRLADEKGWTTRADGSRTPVLDIIIDTLSYDNEMLHPFVQVIRKAKLKLIIILTYFQKHLPWSICKLFVSNSELTSMQRLFRLFSDSSHLRNITKRIHILSVQLLLAHGFQAYLYLNRKKSTEAVDDGKDETLLRDSCTLFVRAFENLHRIDNNLELQRVARSALFAAGAVIS